MLLLFFLKKNANSSFVISVILFRVGTSAFRMNRHKCVLNRETSFLQKFGR